LGALKAGGRRFRRYPASFIPVSLAVPTGVNPSFSPQVSQQKGRGNIVYAGVRLMRFDIDPNWRLKALEDPDLEPLWESLGTG